LRCLFRSPLGSLLERKETSMDCGMSEPSIGMHQSTGACVDMHTCSDVHTCTRYCQVAHVFGNVYQCAQSRQTHVCDQNCTQRVEYDNVSTICRLSRKVFPLTPAELLARQSYCRKRCSGENTDAFCSPLKRTTSAPATSCSSQPFYPPVGQVAVPPFGTCLM